MSERAQPPRYYVGVDSGSWSTKVAVIDAGGKLVASSVARTGADLVGAAEGAVHAALEGAGIAREAATLWSTGFGRHALPFAEGSRTELDSHTRGVLHSFQGPLAIIDIGGQDAKVIRVDGAGKRVSHKMNRKCAAGTGSFLEEVALRFAIHIGELPGLAAGFQEELELGSFCTVFTGTELLAAIRAGKRPADLARAAYKSVVKRILDMERLDGTVVATGGVVAYHPMVLELLSRSLRAPVRVPERPQEMGALGVALAARAAALEQAPVIHDEGEP